MYFIKQAADLKRSAASYFVSALFADVYRNSVLKHFCSFISSFIAVEETIGFPLDDLPKLKMNDYGALMVELNKKMDDKDHQKAMELMQNDA